MSDRIVWKNETRKIADLLPAEYNPRQLTEKQAKDLDTSLTRFNLADPIIINADNKIIGGHQRINVLKRRGLGEVDVRVPSRQLTEHEEKELNLRLNKNLGEWDFDLLAGFDQEMLLDVGFDSAELDKMFQLEPDAKDDEVPEAPETPISKTGDIWLLGRHRVMCGDSTKIDDVEKLMDGKKSQMIHTDPPYNVDYGISKNPRHKLRTIENDKQNPEEWKQFCHDLYAVFQAFNDGDIYMWGASSGEGMRMRLWLIECGCHWSATLHPTMKPVELCEKAILNSSKWNDIVLDLFLGSGSTLIACEKTNRICYGMEIDPKYCDVIVKRWEDFTGLKAELFQQNQQSHV